MELFYPSAARIDCEDCKKYVYDLGKGERKTFKSGPNREEKPFVRNPGVPYQCSECPKGSPDTDCRLSPKNLKTVQLYQEIRAGAGMTEAMREDALLRRNLTIVDAIYREHERQASVNQMTGTLSVLLSGLRAK